MEQRFWKYEGAGNDFVLIDGREGDFNPTAELVRGLCDRHFGIGADGLMILEADPGAEFRMRYFNADGPEGTMCGNGGRCIALFAHHLGIGGLKKRFIGSDGFHEATLSNVDEDTATVELEMIDVDHVEKAKGYYFLNTGSPHYVEFVDNLDTVDVVGEGHRIRYSDTFAPGGTNVNFVDFAGPGHIRIRTYERGVENETLACGTGATAAAIATRLHRDKDLTRFKVSAPGGQLEVGFKVDGEKFSRVTLSGGARRVFEGTVKSNYFFEK